MVLNKNMRKLLLSSVVLLPLLASCSLKPETTCITEVSDLPLKSTSLPDINSWHVAPLRANGQYIMYEAETEGRRKDQLGDYYFVTWYDADPGKTRRLVMSYTQAETGSEVLTREVVYQPAATEPCFRKERFFFTGDARAKQGDILTWKLDLYVDGELKSTKKSYLWR